jgi:hypothetical protein
VFHVMKDIKNSRVFRICARMSWYVLLRACVCTLYVSLKEFLTCDKSSGGGDGWCDFARYATCSVQIRFRYLIIPMRYYEGEEEERCRSERGGGGAGRGRVVRRSGIENGSVVRGRKVDAKVKDINGESK